MSRDLALAEEAYLLVTRTLMVATATLLVLGTLASGAAPATNPVECKEVHLPLLGAACAVDGGYRVTFPDGRELFTHGPDPLRPVTAAPVGLSEPLACVSEEEPHTRVVLAFPSDYPAPQTSQHGKAVIAGVMNANGIVVLAGAKFGVDMRLKTLCDATGLPEVFVVHLGSTIAETGFWSIGSAVYDAGYGQGMEKVWAFVPVDGSSCNCGGYSSIAWDDQPGAENANNFGGSLSVTFMSEFGTTWFSYETALHELTHAMGGVQPGAPDSSGEVYCYYWYGWQCYPTGWHCNDGIDVMCYADGASGSDYSETTCPVGHRLISITMAYDCDNDSYFHPTPPAGSYLAEAWNVGGPNNRYIQRG